jgi:ArsR family transcriptional regulator, arsenate/arsenite/antimonite-responsive transcriptional repressor
MKRKRKQRRRKQRIALYAGARTQVLHKVFRALGDATRLRLLNLVNGREVCVCYLTDILGISQPKISRHLAYLRREGFVSARREGKWMHYRLQLPHEYAAAKILQLILDEVAGEPRMRYDVAHLNAACCSPGDYRVPEGAPVPAELLRPEEAPVFPRGSI